MTFRFMVIVSRQTPWNWSPIWQLVLNGSDAGWPVIAIFIMFCKYNCMISCGDTYNIIWQNIKVIKLGRYWPGINVNQYNITNVCWANSLQTMFLQLFHSKNTTIRPTLNLTQVRQNSDMYLALQLVNERYRYWVSTDTHWYWSVSVLVSDDTRFDTLTILHDLQSQACNVNQKFKWPALYRWLTYGWAPLIPLSHLVQPTEMLTVWWSCAVPTSGQHPTAAVSIGVVEG